MKNGVKNIRAASYVQWCADSILFKWFDFLDAQADLPETSPFLICLNGCAEKFFFKCFRVLGIYNCAWFFPLIRSHSICRLTNWSCSFLFSPFKIGILPIPKATARSLNMESMMVFDGFYGSSLFQPSNLQMVTTKLGPVPYKGLNGSAEKFSSGQRNLVKAIYSEANTPLITMSALKCFWFIWFFFLFK